MSTELVPKTAAPTAVAEWSEQDFQVIRESLANGLDDSQFRYFVAAARRTGLDPLKREIYAWPDGGRVILHTSIGGLTKLAEATGLLRGFTAQIVTVRDENGKLVDIPPRHFDAQTHQLHAVTTGVRHAADPEPYEATALYSEYVVQGKGGGPNARWARAPVTQLAKCAQALALRRRFPAVLGDLFATEEIEHLQNPAYVETQTTRKQTQSNRNTAQTLTIAEALKKGGAYCRGMGLRDENARAALDLFLSLWNTQHGTDYQATADIPEDQAEAVLTYLKSDDFIRELSGESLIPLKREAE